MKSYIQANEKIKKSAKNCHTWLTTFAETQSLYDTINHVLEFGAMTKNTKAPHSKLGLEQLQIKELAFNPNHDVVQIKGASSYNANEEVTKAREYGILVHYILSKIKSNKAANKNS